MAHPFFSSSALRARAMPVRPAHRPLLSPLQHADFAPAAPLPRLLLILLAAAALLTTACAGDPTRAPARTDRLLVTPIHPDTPVFALPGSTVVVPITIQGRIDASGRVPARLNTGTTLDGSAYWIGVAFPDHPDPSPTADTASTDIDAWLGPSLTWSATPLTDGLRPASTGFWAAVIRMPDEPEGNALWLGALRIDLRWLDHDPEPTALEREPAVPEATLRSAHLSRAFERLRASPTERWRERLARGNLRPDRWDGLPGEAGLESPVLRAYARQIEAKWWAALRNLERADHALARRTRARLVRVVDFGGGVAAPAWPLDETALSNLLDDLLIRNLPPQERAARAQAWLELQPTAAAWVIDDAGATDGVSRHPIASIGVANLRAGAVAAWTRHPRWNDPPEMTRLPGSRARATVAVVPTPAAAATITHADSEVVVRAGDWEATRLVAAAPIPVVPPGLRIGPLLPDWTMDRWLSASTDPAARPTIGSAALPITDPLWLTASLVYREQRHTADNNAPKRRWTLYIESMFPPRLTPLNTEDDAEAPADDYPETNKRRTEAVRVWFGPYNAPSAVLRITENGEISDETRNPAPLDATTRPNPPSWAAGTRVSRADDRWSCWIPIPDHAIDADQRIRIAIERVDGRGTRSAWPRSLLPWQREPGRITLNLADWTDPGIP